MTNQDKLQLPMWKKALTTILMEWKKHKETKNMSNTQMILQKLMKFRREARTLLYYKAIRTTTERTGAKLWIPNQQYIVCTENENENEKWEVCWWQWRLKQWLFWMNAYKWRLAHTNTLIQSEREKLCSSVCK